MNKEKIEIIEVAIEDLRASEYNARKHSTEQANQLKESITRFGMVDPIIANSAPERLNIVIGGHFRVMMANDLKMKTVPVVYVEIKELAKEKELNLRLNKNTGEFDLSLLAEFDESFLEDVGFDSRDLDAIFPIEDNVTQFDLKKELEKLNITNVSVKKGDVYELDGSRLACGDSTIESNVIKLMNGMKADMCLTDPPYILDYLNKSKTKQKDGVDSGFGAKKNRRYLETDVLPDNFTELWMTNIKKVAKDDFSIMVYENWKNLRTIWCEVEKHWKVKNMIVWHLPNRMQGFAAKSKFFNKYDIAIVGATENKKVKNVKEDDFLENEYETALFATSGKAYWESYKKGGKYCPTDFIEYIASDEKSSGQGVIFGCKPVEILIPYIKVLTKRGDLIVEPFGGSGSTLIASIRMNRKCYMWRNPPSIQK